MSYTFENTFSFIGVKKKLLNCYYFIIIFLLDALVVRSHQVVPSPTIKWAKDELQQHI